MRIIDRFSSEHDVFVTQLEVIEERTLFPDLEPSLGAEGGPLAVLTEEHHALHGQLDRMTAEPPRWELEQVLDAFLRLLRGHIEKEEGVLFPAAARLIDGSRLERMDREIRRRAGVR